MPSLFLFPPPEIKERFPSAAKTLPEVPVSGSFQKNSQFFFSSKPYLSIIWLLVKLHWEKGQPETRWWFQLCSKVIMKGELRCCRGWKFFFQEYLRNLRMYFHHELYQHLMYGMYIPLYTTTGKSGGFKMKMQNF